MWVSCVLQLMKEELHNEQGRYEKFLQQGHDILDKTDRDSSDAGLVSQQLAAVTAAWDGLEEQLGEREALLSDVLNASTQFQDTVKTLVEWLPLAADAVDALTSQSPAEQREQLKVSSCRRSICSLSCLPVLLMSCINTQRTLVIYQLMLMFLSVVR